jgi:aminoglycoside phosphotransferase
VESWEAVTVGETDAVVRRSPDRTAYAKTGSANARDELVDERERLEWLATTDLPAAELLDWEDDGTTATLTTAALPGVRMSDLPTSMGEGAAKSLGSFLKRLHTTPRDTCPFQRWLMVTTPLARVRVDLGLVDADDFDEERRGRNANDLHETLIASRPRAERLEGNDLVVCHGDACLPNFLVDPVTLEVTGMVDVGRLGLADRHLDLGLATRSTANVHLNPGFGPGAADALLAAYGLPADPWRLDFYRLLDEFF